MDAIIQPVTTWWRAFSLMIGDFFVTLGPREYSYILIATGIAGYFFMKSGKH